MTAINNQNNGSVGHKCGLGGSFKARIIGEKTIANAILDRIAHHSLRVELYGESLRRRNSKSENAF